MYIPVFVFFFHSFTLAYFTTSPTIPDRIAKRKRPITDKSTPYRIPSPSIGILDKVTSNVKHTMAKNIGPYIHKSLVDVLLTIPTTINIHRIKEIDEKITEQIVSNLPK